MAFLHSLSLPENYKIALEGYLSILETVRHEIRGASKENAVKTPGRSILTSAERLVEGEDKLKEPGDLRISHPILRQQVIGDWLCGDKGQGFIVLYCQQALFPNPAPFLS